MTGRFIRLNWTPGEVAPERSRLLERLLSDATRQPEADWRAAAFATLAPHLPMPPIAGARLRAAGIRAEGFACVASAVHLVAELSNVRLDSNGLLRLTAEEARLLADDFNRILGGKEIRMVAAGEVLCCVFGMPLDVRTADPARALGRHVDGFLPSGKDAQRLRGLSSEVEMWLFEHPLNRARIAHGALPVNGLWLWGGGALDAAVPALETGASGEDALFDAFPAPNVGSAGVLITTAAPGSEAWRRIEQAWLKPVALALRRGDVPTLAVSVRDSLWQVRQGRRWKFWRQAKPWWQTFDDAADDPAAR